MILVKIFPLPLFICQNKLPFSEKKVVGTVGISVYYLKSLQSLNEMIAYRALLYREEIYPLLLLLLVVIEDAKIILIVYPSE